MSRTPIGTQVEEQLRNAAYTALGLGVLAYRYTEPQRKAIEAELREAWEARAEEASDRSQELHTSPKDFAEDLRRAAAPIEKAVEPIKEAVENLFKQK